MKGKEKIQGSFFKKIWKGVKKAGSTISSGAKTVIGGFKSALQSSKRFLGHTTNFIWRKLKSYGKTIWTWLSKAGSHVWRAIKWLGTKAWEGIKWVGIFLWEKLSLIGENLWYFLKNIPVRLWRIVIHSWNGIKGAANWVWSGIKNASKHLFNGIVGVFGWLNDGVSGAINWLTNGIRNGTSWAIDFIKAPSMPKLWNGLLKSLNWVRNGLANFATWGWNGVIGAAIWVWKGLKGFGSWLWDALVNGLQWSIKLLFHVLDLVGLGETLQIIWGLIFRMRKLSPSEINASKLVHSPGIIPYHLVRIDENSIISMIGGAAVTTYHIIHTPNGGLPLDIMVHELTHVAQYEHVGSVYMPEAIHAQLKYGRSGGRGSKSAYDYERTGSLAMQRKLGKRFKDLNRESQAELVQDYYLCLTDIPPRKCPDHIPFIKDMQRGEF